ncbi:unnamed protein product [Prunus brigantina]
MRGHGLDKILQTYDPCNPCRPWLMHGVGSSAGRCGGIATWSSPDGGGLYPYWAQAGLGDHGGSALADLAGKMVTPLRYLDDTGAEELHLGLEIDLRRSRHS